MINKLLGRFGSHYINNISYTHTHTHTCTNMYLLFIFILNHLYMPTYQQKNVGLWKLIFKLSVINLGEGEMTLCSTFLENKIIAICISVLCSQCVTQHQQLPWHCRGSWVSSVVGKRDVLVCFELVVLMLFCQVNSSDLVNINSNWQLPWIFSVIHSDAQPLGSPWWLCSTPWDLI